MKLTNRPLRAAPGVVSHDGRPMKYAHGQHAAYVLDRCRCEPCRRSNREYERDRYRRLEPAYVLANEARAHVLWLATQGIGRKQIAKVSGVAHGAIWKLMDGAPDRNGPSKRIRVRTHEAIMAVTPSDCGGNLKVIPAGPTWVLLDEMIAAGIPRTTINTALGNKPGTGLQIGHATVSPANRDKVYALHQRWLAGDWRPVRRDSWGNERPCPPPLQVVSRQDRAAAYDDRAALMGALADAVELRLDRPWRHLSACRGRPSRLWFPQRGDTKTYEAAVRICKACPARRECLMANLDEREGIYGGLGGSARRQLRAELAEHPDAGVMAREHGTVRGYRDHLLGGEDACERCKAAQARYQREGNAARTARARGAVA